LIFKRESSGWRYSKVSKRLGVFAPLALANQKFSNQISD
jgi:hypothetical protein